MVNRTIRCPLQAIPDQSYLQSGGHSCGHSDDHERLVPIGYVIVLLLFQSSLCATKLLVQNEEQAKSDNGERLQRVTFCRSEFYYLTGSSSGEKRPLGIHTCRELNRNSLARHRVVL